MIRAVSAVAGGFSNAHELAAAMRLHALLNGGHGSAECAPTARQLALQLPTQALGKTPRVAATSIGIFDFPAPGRLPVVAVTAAVMIA